MKKSNYYAELSDIHLELKSIYVFCYYYFVSEFEYFNKITETLGKV